jgi:hypothetical protein
VIHGGSVIEGLLDYGHSTLPLRHGSDEQDCDHVNVMIFIRPEWRSGSVLDQ